ncbi:MAG TPA: hypothetical protein PKD68_00440 [Candidatus Saccharibacteria bacterium]|nr:hypothetical protein [Candidatus Saccharibacteria bacterium]
MKIGTVRVWSNIDKRCARQERVNLYFGIGIGVLATNWVRLVLAGDSLTLLLGCTVLLLGVVYFAINYQMNNNQELLAVMVMTRREDQDEYFAALDKTIKEKYRDR